MTSLVSAPSLEGGKLMEFTLTLADQKEAEEANRNAPWSSGVHDHPYLEELRKHPLARAELGRPRRCDHVHLSIPKGTRFVAWWGRFPSGYHHRIGRWMQLVEVARASTDEAAA